MKNMIRKSLKIFHIRKPSVIWWMIVGCVTGVLQPFLPPFYYTSYEINTQIDTVQVHTFVISSQIDSL